MVTVVTVGLAAFCWLAGRPSVLAQDTEQTLLAAYVPPQLTAVPSDDCANASVLPDLVNTGDGWMVSARSSGEVRRWRKFDAEFSIQQKSPSAFKGTLQEAKYNLDQTVYEMDNFVKNVEDALTFEYRPNSAPRDASRSYFSPLYDIWDNTRLKSEVNLDMPTGRAFVGFTLQFPIGN